LTKVNSSTSNMRAPVVLEIGGQRLRLNANTDESHLAGLAEAVNERFESIQRSTKNAVPSTLLALVALDLADELQAARRKLDEAREEMRRTVAAAEARTREVEQMARRAVAEAIAEIDRTLGLDEELGRKQGEIETA
jgi:cell division protein ZapA (FtsZ GTPase activity inhibitor)